MANTADFNVYEFNVSKFNSDLLDNKLADTVTLADTRISDVAKPLSDVQFIQDNAIAKQPSKGFFDIIRLAAWLSKKRDPAQDNWSD